MNTTRPNTLLFYFTDYILLFPSKVKNFAVNNTYLVLILVVGTFLRLFALEELPGGLNQDEASAGYDAYAILTHGIDRTGNPYPVHLIAWGSGQNALYSYIAIPFIALFDLSVHTLRLPAALLGSLSILVMYFFFIKFGSKKGALIASFLVAISPWHIMMSRWALECNILPTIILLALTFLLYSREKKYAIFPFTALMALALYAYGTSYLFVPIVLVGVLVYLLIYRGISLKKILFAYLLGAVIAVPIVLFIAINVYEWDPIVSSFGSIPRYTGTNRFLELSVAGSEDKWDSIFINLKLACSILFSKLHDDIYFNSIAEYGYLYICSLPFIVIGLYLSFNNFIKDRKSLGNFTVVLWFIASVAVCASVPANFNRMNVIFYPLIIFAALAIEAIINTTKSKIVAEAIISLFIVNSAFFVHFYFGKYKEVTEYSFFTSLDEAIVTAIDIAPKNEPIYVTNSINMPYIAVLFHTKYNVRDYIATRQIPEMKTMFQTVTSFGRFSFGAPNAGIGKAKYFVVENKELELFNESTYNIKRFKFYSVISPK